MGARECEGGNVAEASRTAGTRRQRRRLWVHWAAVILVTLIVAFVVVRRVERPPTIDGIPCDTTAGSVTRMYQHLVIYDRGQHFPAPGGIGIDTTGATPCLYWLHTYAFDGIIYVESPRRDTYTLGQFFDIWQTPLSRTQLLHRTANATYSIRAYVNGHLYKGDPRTIPLTPYERIVLEYGPPWRSPPPRYRFPSGM